MKLKLHPKEVEKILEDMQFDQEDEESQNDPFVVEFDEKKYKAKLE